jgi:chromosome segregation ATPase
MKGVVIMTKREKELREDLIANIIDEIEEARDLVRCLQAEKDSLQKRLDEMFEEIEAMENIKNQLTTKTEEGL